VAFLDVSALHYGDEWRTEDVDPTGAQGKYSFGCGACHPTDVAKHQNGVVDVDLSAASGRLPGGLKAMNGGAAAYASGSCSGVYCHSSGQATPAFVATPACTSGASLGCGGCHGNPPSYANGGPDGDANSHIFLNWFGNEGGHFAGLPGPSFHKSRHGGPTSSTTDQRAAPITCQACHAETVDPTNVTPGGLFYLDTSITTRLAGGDPARLNSAAWKDTQCLTCHDGGAASPPQGTGKVRPVRHVNGSRDVVFDGRAAPAGYFATPGDPTRPDLGGSAPTRPYFVTDARFLFPTTLPLDGSVGFDPAPPVGPGRATLSYQLSGAGVSKSFWPQRTPLPRWQPTLEQVRVVGS
jgi:predicted CxxxxCH...CXXCH cytochrome family protein